MSRLLDSPFLAGVGLGVFHALWEVALLGLLAWGGLCLLRRRTARARYGWAALCLGAMVLAPTLTALGLDPLRRASGAFVLDGAARVLQAGAPLPGAVWSLAPWLALAWLLGALFMGLRLGGGLWWLERHCVAPSLPAPAVWQERTRGLALRLGIRHPVRLRASRAVVTPQVVGWLRPVLLVPAAAFLGLAPGALEAVLAHELAHVRRGDFLANLLQTCAEAILFFHPAAWWLSGQVRELREHCCDDAAAALCGDPMALAQGLTALERLRRTLPSSFEPAPGLAPGALKGILMPRLTRLFRPQDAAVPSFRGLLLLLAAAAGAGLLTLACLGPRATASTLFDCDFSQVRVVEQPAAPAYPAEAKAARIQGIVEVRLTVDEHGTPVAVEALSGPEELRPTAEAYARGWRFAPVLRDGRPVRARFTLTMPFKLR